jgi:hypothetical protein
MRHGRSLALLLAAALAACSDEVPESNETTRVLGGFGPHGTANPALSDSGGRRIPLPPAPSGTAAQVTPAGDDSALAVWLEDHRVIGSRWQRGAGWSAPEPLERIYGESREVQLVGNGRLAMAVWQHRVGNIHSLRFSRFDGQAWSLPDVVPGALPRPAVAGAPPGSEAPRLEMDDAGNVVARWPSGFHAGEMQVARYTADTGWSAAANEPLASAPTASTQVR